VALTLKSHGANLRYRAQQRGLQQLGAECRKAAGVACNPRKRLRAWVTRMPTKAAGAGAEGVGFRSRHAVAWGGKHRHENLDDISKMSDASRHGLSDRSILAGV